MNVTCPSCSTVYRVDPAKVPERGVRARCRVCASIFQVPAPGAVAGEPRDVSRPEPVGRATPAPAMAPPPAPAAPEPRATPATPPPPPPAPVFAEPPAASPPAESQPQPRTTAPRGVSQVGGARPSVAIPPVVPPAPRQSGPQARPAAAVPPRQPEPPAAPAAPPGGGRRLVNPFMSQDPQAKARRLARALISDLVVYYPDRRKEGLRNGNLPEVFGEEIKKSWEEYREQVGKDIADSTNYFNEALNDILAGGQKIF